MQLKTHSSRAIALLTGGVIAATTLFHPAPAHADKSKTYKYGAIGLGVLGAYMLSKGKTVPGAAAVAGGVYAYKKSRDAAKDDRYNFRTGRYQDDDRYRANYPRYNSYSNASYNWNDRNRDERNRDDRWRDNNRSANRNNYDLSPYLR